MALNEKVYVPYTDYKFFFGKRVKQTSINFRGNQIYLHLNKLSVKYNFT